GLSEREVPADIVLWPIQFTAAGNDLTQIYEKLEADAGEIRAFLASHGIPDSEISLSTPAIVDKLAGQYGGNGQVSLRYSAQQTISVYSSQVDTVREAISGLIRLGRAGIVFARPDYGNETQYVFTGLNDVKPSMVEEATHNARSVALKFAKDSESRLGKIKRANQGQFSVSSRDSQTPQTKKVRVVSTIEYYLAD
ncbi:MAG: SIMPL domain-containing protein, partial [Rhodothermales bacterium]|nr:SIMPL domain-containing protein [Rhodothermales bacterium]